MTFHIQTIIVCCGKINDYLMTEIWKKRICKNVDIYKRNFRHNLAWSHRCKNNCFEQLITSANDPYYFLKDLEN